jgi:hypothetical protein
MSEFKVGSQVKWTSGGPASLEKVGVIQAVVPSGITPVWGCYNHRGTRLNEMFQHLDSFRLLRLGGGGPRRGESYLVAVGKYLYWPRVSQLSLVNQQENDNNN